MACVVCDRIKEKKAVIAYEDDEFIAVFPSKPAAAGHIRVMPKNHFSKIDELSDFLVQKLFLLANFCSSAVFDVFKCHGTNILINEGDDHLCLEVIPRVDQDGINFLWNTKPLTPEEMDDAHNRLKDKCFSVGKQVSSEQKPVMVDESDEIVKVPDEEKVNYLIKHLQKIP